ncbi:type VI-B CRISPR-associated RNA-guided ribonuclease Cas13b [Riemerella anatipestifer]|uniref:Type VI-B CRISPR-associated RNA-guided ribonuclease Cas13b n=3 Tax=Riemerella anatipestifer TaxID=34085 RepID=A0AAP6HGR3_RIEAN|nr:type VI-B CRISPR-associated RNA-guided ribonuclease Cas13b [Riemerella anatipestifer]MCO7355808.1 type VI-B CRISPR-associated RNA-guided ribonuclease Cas13b [Riemerella anatipestifer]MCU7541361.1 type VI-B CRISPR-associated RNA-guided ribonuclease Cas13b [Riemerella anatipestifer]MCU7598698.1 type VI-B CRISPR-associated RNA-guided ribonuclease Cas13b [Riemerella anatipestifer]MCW0495527.1 type VI-B CRISPR-associated RNA-guided ribonuclease Cas13b [Riemerella anatipestifer]MCW0503348.1 type 
MEKPLPPNVYTLKHKFFWGAFLNIARHNAFITICHINEQLGLTTPPNDDKIADVVCGTWNNILNNDHDLLKKSQLTELILKHFPFLAAMCYHPPKKEGKKKGSQKEQQKEKEKEKENEAQSQAEALNPSELIKVLKTIVKQLRTLRNYYSHHSHKKPDTEKDIFKHLYKAFDASLRMVKEDYKAHFTVNLTRDFAHLNRKGKNKQDNPKFDRYRFEKDGFFTESGLLFFTNLFLDKRDAYWMLKKVSGFKASHKQSEKMTTEVFCRSRILLPKLRLESRYDHNQMLLDMLSELSRCPKLLYEKLSEEDKKCFQVEADGFLDEIEEEQNPFKDTLIRHQDRFPYFALRYLDLNELFTSIRFQVDLGTYHYCIYDKKIGDEQEKRHLTRTLLSFGRLQDFTEINRPQEWKALTKDLDYNETSKQPFISKTTPHYHITDNKIGFRLGTSKELYPSLEVKDGANRIAKYPYNSDFVAHAFISVHELLPLMFYQHLTGKSEDLLKETVRHIQRIYKDFEEERINTIEDLEKANQGRLPLGAFPKQMLGLLQNKQSDLSEKAKIKIEKLIAETKLLSHRLNTKLKSSPKLGKRREKLIKTGVLADWLVKDFMRFQPVAYDIQNQPIESSKANSTEFQLIQRALALYGGEKNRLEGYFKQTNLIGNTNPHPFLNKFNWKACRNLVDFYQQYLEQREKFLEAIKNQPWEPYQYCLLLKIPKENRKNLVKGWEQGGISLPRGLFTEAIRETLSEDLMLSKPIRKEIKKHGRVGFISRAITLYFKEKYQDKHQSFYNLSYKLEAKAPLLKREEHYEYWQQNKPQSPTESQRLELHTSDRWKDYLLYKRWQHLEKKLRLYRNQDIMLWLMTLELTKNHFKELNLNYHQLKLENLAVNVQEADAKLNPLNQTLPMVLPVKVYPATAFGEVQYQETPIRTVYIREEHTKALKMGNFKALVKDRRLNGLFSFIKEENDTQKHPISQLRLRRELEIYQSLRVDAFKETLDLEEKLLKKHTSLSSLENKFRILLEEWKKEYAASSMVTDEHIAFIASVRNAFCHNQYPFYEEALHAPIPLFTVAQQTTEEKDGLGIAEALLRVLREYCEIVKSQI